MSGKGIAPAPAGGCLVDAYALRAVRGREKPNLEISTVGQKGRLRAGPDEAGKLAANDATDLESVRFEESPEAPRLGVGGIRGIQQADIILRSAGTWHERGCWTKSGEKGEEQRDGDHFLLLSSTMIASILVLPTFSPACFPAGPQTGVPPDIFGCCVVPSGRMKRTRASVSGIPTLAGCSCMAVFSPGATTTRSTRTWSFSKTME